MGIHPTAAVGNDVGNHHLRKEPGAICPVGSDLGLGWSNPGRSNETGRSCIPTTWRNWQLHPVATVLDRTVVLSTKEVLKGFELAHLRESEALVLIDQITLKA